MKLYAITYRDRFINTKDERQTALFLAKNEEELNLKIRNWDEYKNGDIDKRTIRFCSTIPLSHGINPVIIGTNLEDYL